MSYNTSNNTMFRSAGSTFIAGGNFTVNNTDIHSEAKSGYERLLDFVAANALHDAGHTFDLPRCHPGTRVAVIQTIIDWMAGANSQTRDKDIAWVTGAAGAGKSAIGRTVCERCAEEGTLLASFFFSSGDSTRNHSASLVANIAYQMCSINPAIRQAVSSAIYRDPVIFSRSLRTQFSSLVIGPLSLIFSNNPHAAPRLIVVDGLDECRDSNGQQDILDTLTYVSTSSPVPFRFLVCSRPESLIINFFLSSTAQQVVFKIFLGDEYSPNKDIRLYLSDQFKDIKEGHIFKHLLPSGWPDDEHVDDIVWKSSGHFIYATTVIKYIRSHRHRPDQRLDSVLGLRPPFKDLPFVQLDALYTHIIKTADDPDLLLDILAIPSIHSMYHPIAIENMLALEPGTVEVFLSNFQSIVEFSICSVNLLHKSFADFLFDPQRSKEFCKNLKETQSFHLLRIMQLYSEEHLIGKIPFELYQPIGILLPLKISCEDWNSAVYSSPLKAIIELPMGSVCKAIFANDTARRGNDFFWIFLHFLRMHNDNNIIREAWINHRQSFWHFILTEILGPRRNNWKSNHLFAAFCIYNDYNFEIFPSFSYILDNFSHALWTCSMNDLIYIPITDAEKRCIHSRAAAHCLQALCDRNPYGKRTTEQLLHIGKLYKRIRRLYPWKWHRRTWSRQSEDQRLIKITRSRQKIHLITFRTVAHFVQHRENRWEVLDVVPLRHIHNIISTLLPFEYATFMEGLIKFLPRAARYGPLIEMCKTQAFSPMSMAFPHLSRRARQEIKIYLDRTEHEGVDDEEGS